MSKWVISLSNGETIVEDSNRLNDIYPDNRTVYQKLLSYINDQRLTITGIRLQVNGNTHTFSISSKAKFPTFIEVKEIGYRRRASLNSNGEEESYIGFFIIISNIKTMFWVCERTGDSWLNVEKIEG